MSIRGTNALVATRRQTQPVTRGMHVGAPTSSRCLGFNGNRGVYTGALSTLEIRQRFDAVRKYLYDNMLKLRQGELVAYDDLYARWSSWEINPNQSIAELYGFEEQLVPWENRVRELQGLPPGGMVPGTRVSAETKGSFVTLAAGAAVVLAGGGLLLYAVKPKRAA